MSPFKPSSDSSRGGPRRGAPGRNPDRPPFNRGPQRGPGPSKRDTVPSLRPFLALKNDKGRLRSSQFLLEGVKQIADVLDISPSILARIFLAKGQPESPFLEKVRRSRVATEWVPAYAIEALSDTQVPQNAIAVANFATLKPDWGKARFVTLLDGVQDPGNVGALFRTSLAMGMDAMLLGKGTCEAYNPKVVRSSVASILRMPFEAGVDLLPKLDFLRQKGFTIVGTSSHAHHTLDQVKLRRKVALLVGNEGSGADERLLSLMDATVHIPVRNKVESLNVSVAHGILCHQLIGLRGE